MNLVIDIGNTKIKAGLFEKNNLITHFSFAAVDELEFILKDFNGQVLISNVADKELNKVFLGINATCAFLTKDTPMPITITYETPETLGLDRVLACVGGYEMTKKPCLVVDIGTCMTLDFVNELGVFVGGNISPGPELRFQSMHNFTANLPLEHLEKESKEIGKSTKEALQSGVKYGIVHEIMGTYNQLLEKNPSIQLVLTGGYTTFFDSMLKEGIFAEPNLVLIGLNKILNYNVKK